MTPRKTSKRAVWFVVNNYGDLCQFYTAKQSAIYWAYREGRAITKYVPAPLKKPRRKR